MTGDYPVFDEGSGSLFCQKFLDHLLFGITIRSTGNSNGTVYAIVSLINLIPLVIALVFSQFPGRIWSLVTSLVLSLCLSVTYGLLGRAGERHRRSARGQGKSKRRCPSPGAVGAVLLPVNKSPCVQAAIQLIALLLATIFYIAVYFGVAERWAGVFMAMLWIPALRGLDSAMNVFAPAQLFECSFTNLLYTFCIFIPSLIFLSDKPSASAARGIMWFNVAYALVPPLSFFGILPQFRCLLLYILDLSCRLVKLPTFGGWSILLFPSILLAIIGTSFLSFIPGIFFVIMNIKYGTLRSYTARIFVRFFLAILAATASIVIFCLFTLANLHINPLPEHVVTMWSSHIKFIIPLGIGAGCYLFFQIGSLFSRKLRIQSRIYVIINHIFGVAILVLGVFDGFVSISSYTRAINRTSLMHLDIDTGTIHALSLLHLTISACTDPAALYVSLMLGGLILTVVQLAMGSSSHSFDPLPLELRPASLPAVGISALIGAVADGFLHRLTVGINLYISVAKFAFAKPRKGWRKITLYLLPILLPWNLLVLILSSLLNIPPLPIGGMPILLPSYPRYSQFFYSSADVNLTFGDYMKTVVSTILDTDGRVKPEDTDDILFYDSALQSLSGWSQDMRSEASFCSLFRSKLDSGALGTQGVILPLLTSVGYGGMRMGDIVVLLSDKHMLILRSMGMLSFATGVLCNVTALETKETSCHTAERVSLEELYNAATRHKFKANAEKKKNKTKTTTQMQASITPSNVETLKHVETNTQSASSDRRSTSSSTRKWYWLPRYKFSLTIDDYTYQDYSLAGVFSYPDSRRGLADMFLKSLFVFSISATDDRLIKVTSKLAKCYDHCFSENIYTNLTWETINACLMTHYKDLEEGANMDARRREVLKASILLFHCISPRGWDINETDIYSLFDKTFISQRAFAFSPMASSNLTAMSHSAVAVEEMPVESPSRKQLTERSAIHSRSSKRFMGNNIPMAAHIAGELAELGLDAEDVSVDLNSLAQSRIDAHNRALEEGSARQELVSFSPPPLPACSVDVEPTYQEPVPLALIGSSSFNADQVSPFGVAYGSFSFSTLLLSALDSTPSPLDPDDQELAKELGVRAMKHAVEHSIQCFSIGDTLPSTLAEAEVVISEQLAGVYIDQGDKQQWRMTLIEKKMQRLFTIKPGPRVYSYSHSKVQWDVYTYPSFACEMIWATIQADLLVFASGDEERFSVQSLPAILRNLFCETASAPYGYPLRHYGLMEI